MNKRTNLYEKIIEFIIKSVVPITIVLAFIINGAESSINHILTATMYMIYPEKALEFVESEEKEDIGVTEEVNKEYVKSETQSSVITSAKIDLEIPTDIQKLVKKIYENTEYPEIKSVRDAKRIFDEVTQKTATDYKNILRI